MSKALKKKSTITGKRTPKRKQKVAKKKKSFSIIKHVRKAFTRKGFTIIESVVVLAIGGLIFALVFFAFPALQRAQRDTQRRTNLALIVSSMNDWLYQHRYTVSDAYSDRKNKTRGFCKFYNDYVDQEIVDPVTGEAYKAALWGSTNVIDCQTGKEYNRGKFDATVHVDPNKSNDSWPLMEVGDIQYDDTAYCDGERFEDRVGKNNGRKNFALRVRLENGGYYCLDNGSNLYSQTYKMKK